jgi:MoaA/NifB/PqqE/SkfB family radical SAM enzyme
MTAADYARVAREAMDLGAVNFSFQGGEPLLVKSLDEIIAACRPRRNIISVTTNGTLIDAAQVDRLRRAGVDILTVSLDSSIAAEHDLFRGSPGAFDKTMAGIRLALKNGIHVDLGAVVTHTSLRSEGISGLVRFAAENRMLLYLILPVPAGNWRHEKGILLTDDDLAYIETLTRQSPWVRTDFQANLGGYGCGAAKEILYLTPYGDVLTCPFLHISAGNIFDEPLERIRARALANPWFARYHPRCLVSTDAEFIEQHLSRTFDAERLPLNWDAGFGPKKQQQTSEGEK